MTGQRGSAATEDLQALTAAVRSELNSFHYFELFLGSLITLVAAAATAWLYWNRIHRKEIRHEREAAVSMSREMDATSLKRVLGQVRCLARPFSALPAITIQCMLTSQATKSTAGIMLLVT